LQARQRPVLDGERQDQPRGALLAGVEQLWSVHLSKRKCGMSVCGTWRLDLLFDNGHLTRKGFLRSLSVGK
jgi:hypothetical protein